MSGFRKSCWIIGGSAAVCITITIATIEAIIWLGMEQSRDPELWMLILCLPPAVLLIACRWICEGCNNRGQFKKEPTNGKKEK